MPEGILRYLKTLASRARTPTGAKQSQYLFAHMGFFAGAAAIAAIYYLMSVLKNISPVEIAIVAAIAIIGAFVATMMFVASDFAGQHSRDLKAFRLFQKVMKGLPAPPFGVLIRPFSGEELISPNALPNKPWNIEPSKGAVYAGPQRPMSMEARLTRGVEKTLGPLMTMGAPIFGAGAGRAPVAARDWDKAAGELADRAGLIFFVPGINESAKSDLEELLKSPIIRRTIIIEPGAKDEDNTNDVEADSVIRWNSLRAIFAKQGYALPPKSQNGALIYFGVAGAEPRVMPFTKFSDGKLHYFLNFVARAVGAKPGVETRELAPLRKKPA